MFNRGDICIGQNFTIHTEYNGLECIVSYGPTTEIFKCLTLGTNELGPMPPPAYLVRWASGEEIWVHESNLKKKPPKKRDIDKIVSWDDCAWKPKEVTNR